MHPLAHTYPTITAGYGSVCEIIPHHKGFIHYPMDFCDPNNSNIYTGNPLCSIQYVTHFVVCIKLTFFPAHFMSAHFWPCALRPSSLLPQKRWVFNTRFKAGVLAHLFTVSFLAPAPVHDSMLQWPGATALLHVSPVQGPGMSSRPVHCHTLPPCGLEANLVLCRNSGQKHTMQS